MLPSELGTEIGPGFRGVKALVVTGNKKVALLRWPFFLARKVRKSRVLARWVGPDYVRPVWGESPPPVADVPKDDNERKAPLYDGSVADASGTGVAEQIAIDAGALSVCDRCGQTVRTDVDAREAYKLGNTLLTQGQYRDVFPSRRAMTDAIKSIIDAAPNACACGAKPKAEDTQKKASQDREQVPDRSKGTTTKKPQQMQPSTSQAQAKPSKERRPEADPFGDLVAGVLADAILPGASIGLGIIDTAGEATPDAPGATPPTPGIPEPEDEREAGHEPEAGD
jgi:hypothetical protein